MKYVVMSIVNVNGDSLYREDIVEAPDKDKAEVTATEYLQGLIFTKDPDVDEYIRCHKGFRPNSKNPVFNYVRRSAINYFFVSKVDPE
jgi:hypothetical protein